MKTVGLPVSDTDISASDPKKHVSEFERGIISGNHNYNGSGVWPVVYGPFYPKYEATWYAGLPIGNARPHGDGARQEFVNGELVLTPAGTVHYVMDRIRDKWDARANEKKPIGFPVEDTLAVINSGGYADGVSQRFEKGTVFTRTHFGDKVFVVQPPINTTYLDLHGGPAGWLGYPTGDTDSTYHHPHTRHYTQFDNGILVTAPDLPTPDGTASIAAFSNLTFYVDHFESHGKDGVGGVAGELDLYSYVTIERTGGDPIKDEIWGHGPKGSWTWKVTDKLKHDFIADVTVDTWDSDRFSPDDHVGKMQQRYWIHNLWGKSIDNKHSGSHGGLSVDAWFDMQTQLKYDNRKFRQGRWWSFSNFATPELTKDQFYATFADVGPGWFSVFNDLYYKKFKGIAANGNCLGFGVESIYSDRSASMWNEPIFDYFPDTSNGIPLPESGNAKVNSLINTINIKQAYQIGADVLSYKASQFRTGNTHNPQWNALASKKMFLDGGDPFFGISWDEMWGGAHVVRPFEWDIDAQGFGSMKVADSNRPFGRCEQDSVMDVFGDNEYFYCGSGNECSNDQALCPDAVYRGDEWAGGRIMLFPFGLFDHKPVTPFNRAFSAVNWISMFFVGEYGRVKQISDGRHQFFENTLMKPPTRWDQIIQDPAERMVDIAPITSMTNGPENIQWFASTARGVEHTFSLVEAEEAPDYGTYEAVWHSPLLSCLVEVPIAKRKTNHHVMNGDINRLVTQYEIQRIWPEDIYLRPQPTSPIEMARNLPPVQRIWPPGMELIQQPPNMRNRANIIASDIGGPNRSIALEIPNDGSVRSAISWTVAGHNKHRWVKLAGYVLSPNQRLTARFENGGYRLLVHNDGPTVWAQITVQSNYGAKPVELIEWLELLGGETTVLEFRKPKTKLSLENVVYGSDDWLIERPTVVLSAQDYSGTGLVGTFTSYKPPPGGFGSTWSSYTAPFTHKLEGENTLLYYSSDNAHNVELIKEFDIKLDTLDPSVTVSFGKPTYTRVENLPIIFNATDPTPGSGILSATAEFDGTKAVSDGDMIELLWFEELRAYSLVGNASDKAGRKTTEATSFDLIATPESLLELLDVFYSLGLMPHETWIRLREIASEGQWEELLYRVTMYAQFGIDPKAAKILQIDTAYVMAHEEP